MGIMATLETASAFSLVKLKPVLIKQLGMDGLFLFFAGVVFVVILLTKISFPEQSPEKNEPCAKDQYVRRCSSVSVL